MTMTLRTSAIPQITWIKTTAKLMGILTTRAMGEGMVLDTQSKGFGEGEVGVEGD